MISFSLRQNKLFPLCLLLLNFAKKLQKNTPKIKYASIKKRRDGVFDSTRVLIGD